MARGALVRLSTPHGELETSMDNPPEYDTMALLSTPHGELETFSAEGQPVGGILVFQLHTVN